LENNVQYIGETLWPGQLGHFFIILSFLSIAFTAVAAYRQSKLLVHDDTSWRTLSRIGFALHGISVFSIIGILFYIMLGKHYEYGYAFDHVSDDLPWRYIFSAFWEGQEGSFLLWMFWHVILGAVIIKTAKQWESPVLLFLALIQTVIASMLLGIHIEIGDFVYKVGSNPTLLLRDVFDAPIFNKADYVFALKGNGLNPLLQNYWMTIHPPTLFLGFASVTIPFSYAAAGFFTRQYTEWLKPALKWSLFSGGILGIGILMGGAWAYEALTFGGYWAWDPVENMSLVPWIIMVAGIHTNLIARSTGRAVKSTFVYYGLSFVLILYSTYLTRSGILGDSSVHSFTEMGLEPQLIFMVASAGLLVTFLYFRHSRQIATPVKEEAIVSREFWMFVGSLILFFSALIITMSTSLPVLNAVINIFNPDFVGTVIKDPIPHYNKFQIWIAILITLSTGKTIYLRYKDNEISARRKKSLAIKFVIFVAITALLTYLTSLWIDYFHWKYTLLAYTCFFTVVANFALIIQDLKANSAMVGSVLSHAGFGIMILGSIASGLNEKTITSNPFAMRDLMPEEGLADAVKILEKKPFFVNDYWITWENDTTESFTKYFKLKFEKENPSGVKEEPFYVYPNLLYSNDLTKVAAFNPDTKHYLDKDIFVHIAGLPAAQLDVNNAKEIEDSLVYKRYNVGIGDTIDLKGTYAIVENINFDPQREEFLDTQSDIGMGANLSFHSKDDRYHINDEVVIGLKKNMLYQYPVVVNDLRLKVKMDESSFDNYFTQENLLKYKDYKLKSGESFEFNNRTYILEGFNSDIKNINYSREPDDLALKGLISYQEDGDRKLLEPIYVIRDNRPFSIKDYEAKGGTHIRLAQIDPTNEVFVLQLAQDIRTNQKITLDIAENVPRTDIIVLEATIFPGINLFWLGSIMMMLGFFVSLGRRYKSKYG
jgi:cytochrome c-type biogenesis protein CcmF